MYRRDGNWLLAVDLSTPRGVLVLDGPGGMFHREIEGDARVSRLFMAAGEVASDAGIGPRDVDLIGVGRGPGSFTGVRVAVTAAKIMGAVLDLPLVAPDTLMVTATAAMDTGKEVFAALDARRGEVYYALYHLDDGYPQALIKPCVAPPQAAASALRDWIEREKSEVIGVGNGIDAYPHAWPPGMDMVRDCGPEPAGLSRLCRIAAGRGEHIDPFMLLPFYLRRPDARERFGGNEGRGKC
ncbi:MAG: tRNA (adenosine(37)-N6)-threonylcarbamoyltransferase complex dimerization subunit type 1 TsaB [Actinobacteria bacterium]|nr:tRNA (adenosine(37)-N6)-threonylcarbamoyltransferase complex dimerization subunit type 1 TsaB [Actinomycetota bacterium]